MEESMDSEEAMTETISMCHSGISRERQAHLFQLALTGHDDIKKCSKEELNVLITFKTRASEVTEVDLETYVSPVKAPAVLEMILLGSPLMMDPQPDDPPKMVEFGVSLLHVAASQGHTELVRLLLDMGCDVNQLTHFYKRSILYMALLAPDEPPLALIEMLVEAGVNMSVMRSRLKLTALHLAVQRDYASLIPVLVAAGCPLDALTAEGMTALYMAVSSRHLDSIRELVRAGASANIATPMGWTPLFLAVRSNRMDIPQLLVTGNCDVNVKGYGGTALHHAVYHANLRSVKLLLEAGADPDVASEGGHTPLTVAAYNNSKAIVEALLAHGCKVNQSTSHGYTALHLAAWDGHTEIVDMLLTAGALHDEPTRDLNTPLALACHGNKPEVVSRLLSHGCKVNNRDKDGDTPLHYVAYNGCMSSLQMLLEAGAHPDMPNNVQATPIWNAVHMMAEKVVYELIRCNVTLNIPSKGINQHAQTDHVVLVYTTPRTPLFVALDRGLISTAKVLILAGTDMSTESWFWRREFPAALEKDIVGKQQLLALACSPLSLRHLCRAYIRRHCGMNIKTLVSPCEIPSSLKDFLLLKYL